MKESVFIFGFGYTAAYFTKLLTDKQYTVYATSRNPVKKQEFIDRLNIDNNYFKLIDFDNSDKADEYISGYLNQSAYILSSISPNSDRLDIVLDKYKEIFIENRDSIRWLGYLSSTGVYGNHHGQWVDESSLCLGQSSYNINRIKAEKSWLDLYQDYNLPVHIYRLAGIYGPGQCALDKLLSGKKTSIFKPSQFFSRVHVEDIAQLLYQSLSASTPGEIYNICDDKPAASHEVDAYAAGLLGINDLELVNYQDADLSSMAMSFYQSNKKVSNKKIKDKLSYKFLYPDYKSGLDSIFQLYYS